MRSVRGRPGMRHCRFTTYELNLPSRHLSFIIASRASPPLLEQSSSKIQRIVDVRRPSMVVNHQCLSMAVNARQWSPVINWLATHLSPRARAFTCFEDLRIDVVNQVINGQGFGCLSLTL